MVRALKGARMRSRYGILFVLVSAMSLIACGGDDDGGGVTVDASVQQDAAATDAPSGNITSGLGKSCAGAQDCSGNGTATVCLQLQTPSGVKGYCSQLCAGTTINMSGMGTGTFMTDNATPPAPVTASIMPPTSAWDDAPCQAAYMSSVGSGACASIVNLMPAPAGNPPQYAPNTTYSFAVACGIGCGAGNTCPTGFTCNAQSMLCSPS